MAAVFTITEEQIASGLRRHGLLVYGFEDLTREERELVQEYAGLVFNTAKRELLDMLVHAIRRRRGSA